MCQISTAHFRHNNISNNPSMLAEMDFEATLKNCFIEADVNAMDGSKRSWG
ncbi:MAG: hypothetical protein HQK67_07615 [Desulfamplus sp.]|nr:hypothetical protein [Desulfamplus sp.]